MGQLPAHQDKNHSREASQLPGRAELGPSPWEVALARTPEGVGGDPQGLHWGRAWAPQMAQELAGIYATRALCGNYSSGLQRLPSSHIKYL